MPREQIRVFLSSSPEQMETMLGRENQGLLSTAITVDQLWDKYRVSWIEVRRLEVELGAGAIMIVPTPGACLPQGRRFSPGRSCLREEIVVRSSRRQFLDSFQLETCVKKTNSAGVFTEKRIESDIL